MRIIHIIAATLSLTFAGIACANEINEDSEPTDIGTKLMESASSQDPEKANPLEVEVNPQQLEDKYTKDPQFSGESTDQNERDIVIAAIEDKLAERSTGHILNLQHCQKLVSIREIKKCREAAVIKKSK